MRAVPKISATVTLVLCISATPGGISGQTVEVSARGPGSQSGLVDHEAPAPTLRAHPMTESIEIDGVLDESVWRGIDPITEFTQQEPNEGEEASEVTEVRIVVGPDAIYVGARMTDSEPQLIRSTLVRRDVMSDNDFFSVNLDSRHDHNTAFFFTLTPSGTYLDGAQGVDGQLDFNWDPVWEGASSMDSGGWSAEFRIPFSQLRFSSADDAVWGIQLRRFIARKGEESTTAFTPRSVPPGPHRFGHLEGLGSLDEPERLELLPYVTGRSEHLHSAPGDPFRSEAESFLNAGLDLKYGLTSSLTLDATINPDFGQVEVDPAVVNLTDYETFFPERRPFFVENAEMFRFGFPGVGLNQPTLGSLFYSRRIGRPPQRSLWSLGAQYVDTPERTNIAGAVKVSGRVGSWSLGLVGASTLEEKGSFISPEGVRDHATVAPLTHHMVARVRRDFRGGNTTLGGITTVVNRDLWDEGLAGILHSSAYVAGVDFNHLWKGREWFLNGTIAGSRVEGTPSALLLTQRSSARYFQRPDADHIDLDPNRTSLSGWRGSLSLGRQGGDHWVGSILLQAKDPGFEANDLGFESRVDTWDGTLLLQYRDMEPGRLLRRLQVDFLPALEGNFSEVLGGKISLGSLQVWSNYWMSSTMLLFAPERDDDRMTRGGPMARAPARWSASQWVSTDQRKPYTLEGSVGMGWNVKGGWGVATSVGVSFRPTSALEVTLSPTHLRVHSVAQFVHRAEDPTASRTFGSRYVFSSLDQTTLSFDTRVSWTFTPRLSLQLYAQPFLASGDYSGFKEMHQPRAWGWDLYGVERGSIQETTGGFAVDPDGAGPSAGFVFGNPDFNMRSLRGNAVLRWEFNPGSSLYLVWQQRRFGYEPVGEFDLGGDSSALWDTPPENVFAVKVSYWWAR